MKCIFGKQLFTTSEPRLTFSRLFPLTRLLTICGVPINFQVQVNSGMVLKHGIEMVIMQTFLFSNKALFDIALKFVFLRKNFDCRHHFNKDEK